MSVNSADNTPPAPSLEKKRKIIKKGTFATMATGCCRSALLEINQKPTVGKNFGAADFIINTCFKYLPS